MSYSVFNDKTSCCGCTGCANTCPKGAITMCPDEEGFLYPVVDETLCVECGLCKKVCAFQQGYSMPDRLSEPLVYAAKASDEIRSQSSSGGAFTVLSDAILNQGGAVYGVAFDENITAVHTRAETVSERNRQRGSKYSQSDLKDTFRQIKNDLAAGRPVMFTGTSCQNAALRSYLSGTPTDRLVQIDILCHGTPSPKLFSEYIGHVEKLRKKKVTGYQHRSKDFGWGHDEKIYYSDGTTEIMTALSDSWKKVFYSNLCLRPACHECKYTNFERPSDITIADFWGIETIDKAFSDRNGVSLLIISTQKGENLLKKVFKPFQLSLRTPAEAELKNPNLNSPTARPSERETFWADYQNGGIALILSKYGNLTFKNRVKKTVKRTLNQLGLLTLLKKLLKK